MGKVIDMFARQLEKADARAEARLRDLDAIRDGDGWRTDIIVTQDVDGEFAVVVDQQEYIDGEVEMVGRIVIPEKDLADIIRGITGATQGVIKLIKERDGVK